MTRLSPPILALLLLPGCGTISNLNDPPMGPYFMGCGKCSPFFGVTRSAVCAVAAPGAGIVETINGCDSICRGEATEGFQQIGQGALCTSMGLLAIVETPLSLAGDIVTYPIARARAEERPWATWWGKQTTDQFRDFEKALGGDATGVGEPESATTK